MARAIIIIVWAMMSLVSAVLLADRAYAQTTNSPEWFYHSNEDLMMAMQALAMTVELQNSVIWANADSRQGGVFEIVRTYGDGCLEVSYSMASVDEILRREQNTICPDTNHIWTIYDDAGAWQFMSYQYYLNGDCQARRVEAWVGFGHLYADNIACWNHEYNLWIVEE